MVLKVARMRILVMIKSKRNEITAMLKLRRAIILRSNLIPKNSNI